MIIESLKADKVPMLPKAIDAVAAGGRDEETLSGYAEGIRVEQYPSSR